MFFPNQVMPDEVEDEFVFKQRQEDREREQLKIEKLEKQIGAADGSLKRLGKSELIIVKKFQNLFGIFAVTLQIYFQEVGTFLFMKNP